MVVQVENRQEVDETDGLPFPQRFWAIVAIAFALCMSVLDINISNVILPTLSHDFGTSPSMSTWIVNGYQLAIVVSLLSFSSLGEPENLHIRRNLLLYHFTDVCIVRFFLDTDRRPCISRVQCIGHHKCEHRIVTTDLS